jgi:FKBP-type peptidyl-prolyl cis-trans isomerase FklB
MLYQRESEYGRLIGQIPYLQIGAPFFLTQDCFLIMMKPSYFFSIAALLLTSFQLFATELSTPKQQFSYAMGLKVAPLLLGQGIGEIDVEAFTMAVEDILNGKKPRLTQEQIQNAMKRNFEKQQANAKRLANENLEKGTQFREAYAKKEGVTSLENGLLYRVITAGEGASPGSDQRVEVQYRGQLVDGKEFDSSYKRGKPVQFNLKGVVPGFREAITRMKPGAKWEVVMPPELAYGEKGAGTAIGPNETLIFEIEYLRQVEEQKK